MRIFTNRYFKAIVEKKLIVVIPGRLRRRLHLFLKEMNQRFQIESEIGWNSWTDSFTETISNLKLAYGERELQVKLSDGSRGSVDTLGAFLDGCYPNQVLDIIEAFSEFAQDLTSFTDSVNEMFEDCDCPWRLDDREFFAVDQSFFGLRVSEHAELNLRSKAFYGACAEFREARQDLLAGDTKGCISNSQKALESVLKTILQLESGNASTLIRKFVHAGFIDDLPNEFRTSFSDQVMMTVPSLGNRLGRHGQGKNHIEIPISYAQLTLEITAAFLNFLVKIKVPTPANPEISESSDDETIPF